MKINKYYLNLLIFVFFCLFLYGCGSNLFSSLGLAPKPTEDMSASLDNASTVADYTNIKDAAQKVIDDPNASAADKNAAQFTKGEALLGESQITIVDIIADFSKSSSSNDTIFARLKEKATTSSIVDAAKAMNSGGVLTDDQKVVAGLTNSMAAIYVLDQYYVLDAKGVPTSPKTGYTAATALNGAVTGGATTFGNTAGTDLKDTLPDSEQSNVTNMQNSNTEIEKLNTAVQDTGHTKPAYTNTAKGITTPVDEYSSDADINSAVTKLYQ